MKQRKIDATPHNRALEYSLVTLAARGTQGAKLGRHGRCATIEGPKRLVISSPCPVHVASAHNVIGNYF